MSSRTPADRLDRCEKLMSQGLKRSEVAEYFNISVGAAGHLMVAVRKRNGTTNPARVEASRRGAAK